MFNFEKLTIYQKATEFSLFVYKLTQRWPKSELFGLTDQLKRAAVSIALNIAEGSGRTKKEFVHFLDIARGSCYECIALLQVASKLEFITHAEYQNSYAKIMELSKMINRLRTNLKSKI